MNDVLVTFRARFAADCKVFVRPFGLPRSRAEAHLKVQEEALKWIVRFTGVKHTIREITESEDNLTRQLELESGLDNRSDITVFWELEE